MQGAVMKRINEAVLALPPLLILLVGMQLMTGWI
jgi:hypothetical protein